jgi:hypothetical protein
MKTWTFALLEALIAALGLAAYFLADDMVLASSSAILAAALGIAQPLLAARRSQRFGAFQERQHQKSVDAIDRQLDELSADLIPPPLPHRATVAALLRTRLGDEADALLHEYDELIHAIQTQQPDAVRRAGWLSSHLGSEALEEHLQGLAAFAVDDLETAHRHFSAATRVQPAWIAPWLGWAASAYQLQLWDEITDRHPQMHGCDLQPYDVGDESTFLQLSAGDREELVPRFQDAAQALINYHALVEIGRSKQQMKETRDAWKKVA